jgi:hypothetical protein
VGFPVARLQRNRALKRGHRAIELPHADKRLSEIAVDFRIVRLQLRCALK